MITRPILLFLSLVILAFYRQDSKRFKHQTPVFAEGVVPGAAQIAQYLPDLAGKNVGVLLNNNALLNGKLSIDTLEQLGVRMVKRFGAERTLLAKDGSNLLQHHPDMPLVYLYGDKDKPNTADMAGIDVMLVDVQDLGVRFYIYLATLHSLMEACAENNVKLILLDRPNPIGSAIDGPILDPGLRSFLGADPLPVTHGLTLGEYAAMINGEGWLNLGIKCDLKVIKLLNYTHGSTHSLPNPPFPNLNTAQAIQLYPSLCWFDGTVMSQGRGTPFPFTVVGHPELGHSYTFSFTPQALSRTGTPPPYHQMQCYGLNLKNVSVPMQQIGLSWLLATYRAFPKKATFFNPDKFDKLAGTAVLREQVQQGLSEKEIRKSWAAGLHQYKKIRAKYLLYP